MMKSYDVQEYIEIGLTDAEVSDRAMQMVKETNSLRDMEDKAKTERDTIKRRLKAQETKIDELRTVVNKRSESREVKCKRVYDVDKGKTWLEYEGKQYHSRSIRPDEKEKLTAKDWKPVPQNPGTVTDIEEVRRAESSKKGKKDLLTLK